MKIAISIHEPPGGSPEPVAVVVPDGATEPQCMQAAAVAGCVVWEIRDGQQFGRYRIRIESVEPELADEPVPG